MNTGQRTNGTDTRPPPWRDVRVLRITVQVAFLAGVAALLWLLANNLVQNMQAQGMRTDFGFLGQAAGFPLAGADFSSRDSIWAALVVGLRNTLVVSAWGIVLATVLGVFVGIARLSSNWLVRKCAAAYVEALRNIPLIVFLLFLYLAILQQLPRINDAIDGGGFVFSNRGLYAPWFDVDDDSGLFLGFCAVAIVLSIVVVRWRTRRFNATGQPHHRIVWGAVTFGVVVGVAWLALGQPVSVTLPVLDGRTVSGGYELTVEHGALLLGLVLYMAAFVAEIVRGSILAVPKGQAEAANALGLSGAQRYRHVVLPQALRIAIPPAGNEFINLAKNSALGIAIAFPELLRVTRIAIGQGQPAPQLIGIMMLMYLAISLTLSLIVNVLNRRLGLRGV
ncbi:amino acid ABC transporter permease [Phytoactinopolyspora limicola]|uniref:amino acid ABC transporter permease n=1 Tax=Phytoactinopolyspora limicola TaxID=2715536 RepID=UPI00140E00A4|nr:ABC transporter permease subunit [Phytoactinopolyspora limicola]